MRKLKYLTLAILIPVLMVCLGFGIYYISYEWSIQSNINKMEEENEYFYEILNVEGIDVHNYGLYEEIFIESGVYYLVFFENGTGIQEGDIIQGIMLRIETDIDTEYVPSIDLVMEDSNYVLPSLWIAGGGSALGTSQAFFKRAELRRLILENNTNITQQSISIKIEGSYCLGKLEF
ncbi:MAG: hypothetical protein JXL85_06000 [Bacilli bacterium]|nr:hypothetical protein [Bacilli bacterium]